MTARPGGCTSTGNSRRPRQRTRRRARTRPSMPGSASCWMRPVAGERLDARFQGALDEARVWSAARSQTQILSTINDELATGASPRGSVGHERGAGTAIDDSVPPDADGTITGTGATRVTGAPFDSRSTRHRQPHPPASRRPPVTGPSAWPGRRTARPTSPDTTSTQHDHPVSIRSPLNGTTRSSAAYTDAAAQRPPYHYVVTAVDDLDNRSTASNEVTATPTAPPEQPTGLQLGAGGAYVTSASPRTGPGHVHDRDVVQADGAGIGHDRHERHHNFIRSSPTGARKPSGSAVDANWLLGINDTTDVLAADFEDTASGLNHPTGVDSHRQRRLAPRGRDL